MIPFLSLKDQTAVLREEILAALGHVVDTQGFSNGPAVAKFEKELAAYLGCREVVCVNSGTTSVYAALLSVGVGAGDEVVTVPNTFIATAWAISYTGARPVFVDADRNTCGMDPSKLASAITPKTKAILPVHLYGQPVDLDPILEFARNRGIPVIEDSAQAVGAKYKGRHTGTIGLVNATSFYPGKNLGAFGEGGAVMTDDPAIADRIRSLRDHAQRGRHNHVELGFNWRMDGFQGAVLSVKLPHLDGWNARRRDIAARYFEGLGSTVRLSLLPLNGWSEPIWHIFPVFHAQRDEFRARLESLGIQTGVHYPRPVHFQPAYSFLGYKPGDFPVAEELAASEISLPMFPELSDEHVDQVIKAVVEVSDQLHRAGGVS
jgi:Predicted pyridoxal phosphate-dependent enzyme apparently involved in regulation of cell wall biogenesis